MEYMEHAKSHVVNYSIFGQNNEFEKRNSSITNLVSWRETLEVRNRKQYKSIRTKRCFIRNDDDDVVIWEVL